MPTEHRVTSLDSGHGIVSVVFDGPPTSAALLVLAHGAGGGMHSDFMSAIAHGLASQDVEVCRFNFPYIEQGRRAPDRQPVLEAAYKAVLAELAEARKGRVLVIGGKSLGGRIASHVAGDGEARGLVLLGYPLHPPGKPERLRAEHLVAVTVPMLFIEGTRDPFCPLPTLRRVLSDLSAPVEVAEIEDGDHSFRVRRSSGRVTQQAWGEVADATTRFVRRLCDEAQREREA